MTNSQMFKEAHKQAKLDCKAFGGLVYKEAFGRALKGFYAVNRGYAGVTIVEPRRLWA